MFIERTEQGKPGGFSHLSDEELDAQPTEKLRERGMTDGQIKRFLDRTALSQAPTAPQPRQQISVALLPPLQVAEIALFARIRRSWL
jgi:hypothetical protein